MSPASDVVVVGGGIIGLAIAREAARAGLSVLLLERGETGGEASGAAAGLLSVQAEGEHAGPLLRLGLLSRMLYPAFAAAVREESGVDPELRGEGILALARGEPGPAALDRLQAAQPSLGLGAERLRGSDLRRLEPGLDAAIDDGLLLPHDRSIDNAALVRGLRLAAARAGVRILEGLEAHGVVLDRGRAVAVATAAGRRPAGAVVIAAGAWSSQVPAEEPPPFATHPVRGQIACFHAAPGALRHPLWTGDVYLVPRGDGRILAGSTMERVGFDRSTTPQAIAALREAAVALLPSLRSVDRVTSWAGLRPATGDGLPVIGGGTAAGLFYATGHLRNGILLAPVTASLVGRVLRGAAPAPEAAPFSPRRFAAAPPAGAGPPRPAPPPGS
jgi:glycine oxidase